MICGWLSPTGEFYSCNQYGHISLADKLIRKYYLKSYSARYSVDDFLIKINWIKLYEQGIGYNSYDYVHGKHEIFTNEQFEWLSNSDLSPIQNSMFSKLLALEGSM